MTQRCLPRSAVGALAVLCSSTLVALACGGMEGSSSNARDRWDTDGDGFSNNVELHLPNALYHLDTAVTNYDSTSVFGSLSWGQLLWAGRPGGINLPGNVGLYQFRPNPEGSQYWDPLYDRPDSNDWGTLTLVNFVEAAGRAWVDMAAERDVCFHYQLEAGYLNESNIGIGDISKFGGGHWYHSYDAAQRHGNHAIGLELDIRYLRLDGAEGPLDIRTDPNNYDVDATVDLVNCLMRDDRVEVIYVDAEYANIENVMGTIIQDGGSDHRHHLHVQIRYP